MCCDGAEHSSLPNALEMLLLLMEGEGDVMKRSGSTTLDQQLLDIAQLHAKCLFQLLMNGFDVCYPTQDYDKRDGTVQGSVHYTENQFCPLYNTYLLQRKNALKASLATCLCIRNMASLQTELHVKAELRPPTKKFEVTSYKYGSC